MSGKSFCLASLMTAVLGLGLGTVRGQGPASTPPGAPPASATPAITDGAATAPAHAGNFGLSRWILYDRQPGCCGPLNGGPIDYEVSVRSGVSLPIPAGGLGGTLDNGWMIEGDVRTLFFNPTADAAWTIELGLGNIYNRVGNRSQQFLLTNLPTTNPGTNGFTNVLVTGADLNRTYVSAALGKEWYLWGSAEKDVCEGNWRVGFDLGGRWGTEKLDLVELQHRTDTTYGLFVALHTDLEFSCGACIYQLGLRGEYGYTWTNIYQSANNADIQDLNLLATFGVRF